MTEAVETCGDLVLIKIVEMSLESVVAELRHWQNEYPEYSEYEGFSITGAKMLGEWDCTVVMRKREDGRKGLI
jgi:hypothetical protein